MIRGLIGVVPSNAVEVGRFYIEPGYRDSPRLFQCIQSCDQLDEGFAKKAFFLTEGGKPQIAVSDVPNHSSLVALDDVHVRVDPTSLANNSANNFLRRGTFLVSGDEALYCVPTGFREWGLVNISTGCEVAGRRADNWLGFTRWSLVLDDEEGDEVTIATFENTLENDGYC